MSKNTIVCILCCLTLAGSEVSAQGVPHFTTSIDSLYKVMGVGFRDSIVFYLRNSGAVGANFIAMPFEDPATAHLGAAHPTHFIQSPPSNLGTLTNGRAFGIKYLGGAAFVKFDLTAPETLISISPWNGNNVFAADFTPDGQTLYGILNFTQQMVTIDTATGSISYIGFVTVQSGETWTSMKFDPTDGTLFATSTSGTRSTLYRIALNGQTTVIGQITSVPDLVAMGIDQSGQMYGYGLNDNFYRINKSSAAATLVGPIGFDAALAQNMDFDPVTDICYLAAYNLAAGRGELRTANTATGATTLIGPLGSNGSEVDFFAISGRSTLQWLNIIPRNGFIAPGDSLRMVAKFDGIFAPPGTHTGYVRITAPDFPSADTLSIRARMYTYFNEPPIIELDRDSLNFGDIPIGGIDSSETIRVQNAGPIGTLFVTNVIFSDTAFSIDRRNFSVPPLDTIRLRFRFRSNAPPATHIGTMHFVANSPNDPEIQLHARSVEPSITIISPNGGEIWNVRETHYLIWRDIGVDTVHIEFSSLGSGGPWILLNAGYAGPDTMQFVGGLPVSSNCFFRVSSRSNPSVFDTNDAPFTITGGTTHWHSQTSGTTANLYSVKAISPQVAWTGGSGGIVRRTIDGGNTWTSAGMVGSDIYALTALDENTALVAADGVTTARIFMTTNGGVTWTPRDSIAGGFYNAIEMSSQTNGLALGDPIAGNWLARRTTNGGNTWLNGAIIPWNSSETMWSNCMMWYDSLHGWFFTTPGSIYRTTDGGTAWSRSTPPSTPGPVWFNQLSLGLSGPGLRSSDAGETWVLTSETISETVSGLSGATGSEKFWATAGSKVYYSSDAGNSWSNGTPFGYTGTSALNHISMTQLGSITAGWAVGMSGTIVHFIVGEDDVKQNPDEIPHEFLLSQNYPNPFNPSTGILFRITDYGLVSLRVYDVLGQEVITLVNEVKQPGRYHVTWDASNVASGVYFYRLQAGDVVQQRKMLLIR